MNLQIKMKLQNFIWSKMFYIECSNFKVTILFQLSFPIYLAVKQATKLRAMQIGSPYHAINPIIIMAGQCCLPCYRCWWVPSRTSGQGTGIPCLQCTVLRIWGRGRNDETPPPLARVAPAQHWASRKASRQILRDPAAPPKSANGPRRSVFGGYVPPFLPTTGRGRGKKPHIPTGPPRARWYA